jgi:hypothetical protein
LGIHFSYLGGGKKFIVVPKRMKKLSLGGREYIWEESMMKKKHGKKTEKR